MLYVGGVGSGQIVFKVGSALLFHSSNAVGVGFFGAIALPRPYGHRFVTDEIIERHHPSPLLVAVECERAAWCTMYLDETFT